MKGCPPQSPLPTHISTPINLDFQTTNTKGSPDPNGDIFTARQQVVGCSEETKSC